MLSANRDRDPIAPTKYENDCTLSGFRPQQRKTFDKPVHIAQMEEPWRRLYDAATSSSFRQSVMYDDRQVPKDSLDFQLKSVYDHHKNFFCKKNEYLFQKETMAEDQRKQDMQEKEEEDDIRMWVDPQRNSVHSFKL